MAVSAGVFAFSKKQIAPPWVWNTIHEFLDSYRNHVFDGIKTDPLHHHRVTLFRHLPSWKYPAFLFWRVRPLWSYRLVPVERSGHTTQKCQTAFLAPDDADQVQGIAGQVWASMKCIIVPGLDEITEASSDKMISEYARQTWVSKEWVIQRLTEKKPLARSYCGIPIRVKGKPWGVIIIDSRNPESIDSNSERFYNLVGESLGKLLERV